MHTNHLFSAESVQRHFSRLKAGRVFDVANAMYGGKIVQVSNEYYGPASQIISPYPSLSMFDGLESARSREANHSEAVEIA